MDKPEPKQATQTSQSPQVPVTPAFNFGGQGQGRRIDPVTGLVLDADGKPCRACNSLLDMKRAMSGKSVGTKKPAVPTPVAAEAMPDRCPPDSEQLGRSSWTLLHSMAAYYPETPSQKEQQLMKYFIQALSRFYPCSVCAEDFAVYLESHPPQTHDANSLSLWMCEAHNEVNRKLSKPEFDCSKWRERWKSGWADGSCD